MYDIPANSIDLICSHNAFEHFAGDSDSQCIREFERILRPGGVALITPFFIAKTHSITLSPAPSFLFGAGDTFTEIVRDELKKTGGRLDFNPNIISPYARRYDINTYLEHIQNASKVLQFSLKRWQFASSSQDDLSLIDHPDIKTPYDIFQKRHFCILEMRKPD